MTLPRHQPVHSDKEASLWPTPSAFRPIYLVISKYYNGDDLLPLSRQRHREQIICYRKACTKLIGCCFILGLLLILRMLRTYNAATVPSVDFTAVAVINSSE